MGALQSPKFCRDKITFCRDKITFYCMYIEKYLLRGKINEERGVTIVQKIGKSLCLSGIKFFSFPTYPLRYRR